VAFNIRIFRALVLATALLCLGHTARAADVVSPPTPVTAVEGLWPAGMATDHEQRVTLTATVRADGTVVDPAVESSVTPALAEAAKTAARSWRFEPARRDDVAIEARVRLLIRFAATAVSSSAPALDAFVRGTRPPRSASEVTRDRAVLQAAPHRSADELLAVIPGIFITQHSGEGKAYQIFYRGFDAVHGQDLEVWAGGAPVNDVSNIHGQGYADLHFLPTEVVRQITATPGTYDPRQGDFAVAGSLRIDLGYDKSGITAKAETGSFATHRYFLAYRPTGSGEGTFAAAELYRTDGFGPSRAAQRASVVAQISHPLDADTSLRLMASTYAGRFSSAGVLRLDDIDRGTVDRFATYDPSQGGASARTQLVAEVHHQVDDEQWTFATYLVLRSLLLRQNFTGYLVDTNGDSEQQTNDDLVIGATGSYQRPLRLFSDLDRIEAGFFARTDWIDQAQKRLGVVDNRITADQVDARVRGHDVAGYLDLALHPLSRLALRGGLRIDGLGYEAQDAGAQAGGQARASQGMHVGKKITADVRVTAGLHALASYGEGFRSPQARSLSDGQTTPFTQVRSAELGVRLIAPRLTASLAGFQTRLTDDLVFDQQTTRNERIPATRRTGAALDVVTTPLRWLTAAASATYTHAVLTASDANLHEGDLMPYAPQWVVRGDAALTPRLGSVRGHDVTGRVGTGLSLLARRPLPYHQFGHDVFLVDGSAQVRVGPVELGLEAFNLLNARWFDGEFVFASRWNPGQAAALVPQRHVTVGAPRTVLATLGLFL
jgi:iron complex outermembrane receptor protein